jgi:hypothetical protein
MIPALPSGSAIHNPGAVGVGLLNDIGWDAVIWIGIEDRIEVVSFPGACCPYPPAPTIMHEGGTYNYRMLWYDEYPYGDYLLFNTLQWKLEVLHRNGRY